MSKRRGHQRAAAVARAAQPRRRGGGGGAGEQGGADLKVEIVRLTSPPRDVIARPDARLGSSRAHGPNDGHYHTSAAASGPNDGHYHRQESLPICGRCLP